VSEDVWIAVNDTVARCFAETYAGDLVVLFVMRGRSLGLGRHSDERAKDDHEQN
jgi:hypothetical protein